MGRGNFAAGLSVGLAAGALGVLAARGPAPGPELLAPAAVPAPAAGPAGPPVADMLAMPRQYLRGVESEAEVQDAMDGWRTRVARWQADLDALARVATELELAKWLDATHHGRDHRPAAWQLAELAAEAG